MVPDINAVYYTGVQNMQHIFSIISLSIVMLQLFALNGQIEDALLFLLHIGMGLRESLGYAINNTSAVPWL